MNEKDDMHPKQYQGRVSYALTKEEKEIFFECLLSMKVPSGFSSNIKGILNMAEKKFQNLKSHDCHVIMTQLLSVALRNAHYLLVLPCLWCIFCLPIQTQEA